MFKYDYLIVGCGLTGAVLAHELKSKNYSVLIIDKRDHIGGNVYTEKYNDIHVHKYGPHVFHTNKKEIWDYVNKFDEFQPYILQTIAMAEDGNMYNLPFNLHTFYQVYGCKTKEDVMEQLRNEKTNCENVEEYSINQIGEKMYNLLVKGYTEKQWGVPCSKVNPNILKRLPIRMSWDNNYFNDEYQGIPKNGYTHMIENMIKDIPLELNTPFDLDKHYNIAKHIIYCGSIDELFNFKYGTLPYRSLRFEEHTDESQDAAIINYTGKSIPYTRSINHKLFLNTTKDSETTIITKEYPEEFNGTNERYYPINEEKNLSLYAKYQEELLIKYPNIIPLGRLGSYKYMNMDEAIESALKFSNNICDKLIIWQVYHDANMKSKLDDKKYEMFKKFYTQEKLDGDNINHIQSVMNEFVCQYYVYKNNIKSNIVGFCHYGKYFSNKPVTIYDDWNYDVNPEIFELNNLDNTCVGLDTWSCNMTTKDYCYQLMHQYIKDKYPERLERFIDMCENSNSHKIIRFESFICKWEDFCKYMEFMLGAFDYFKLPLNKDTTIDNVKEMSMLFQIYKYWSQSWYKINIDRHMAYFVEILCGIYWYIFDYNVICNYKKLRI